MDECCIEATTEIWRQQKDSKSARGSGFPLFCFQIRQHVCFCTLVPVLCFSQDPGVMSAALCALHEVVKSDTRPYKNLIPSFTSILKQVSEHRLPKSYDYHRFPAPFIQARLPFFASVFASSLSVAL